MSIKCNCWMHGKAGTWKRVITFPFPPWPGLRVASFKVKRVEVCQGGLDGEGTIEVQFNTDESADSEVLTATGWEWSE